MQLPDDEPNSDWFRGDNATAVNLLQDSYEVLLMDQLWPRLAAGNAPDESQWQGDPLLSPQASSSDFTSHPHLPLEEHILPSTHPAPPTDADKKGSSRRIPLVAKRILEDSFVRHRDHPYIPQDELQELVRLTGLTTRQVRTFFANARARKLPPLSSSSKPEASERAAASFTLDQSSVPLDRYLSSSSGQEGVDEDVVHEAAKRLRRPLPQRRHRTSTAALSVSGSNAGSSSSSAGGRDYNQTPPYDSLHHRGSRRGRRRRLDPVKKQITSVARKPSSPSRKFQCTFCTNDFTQKYDWRRHEESVHFPQKDWVCMPDGPLDEDSCCVFCDLRNPDKKHLDSHKSITCSQVPRAQRAFMRKDKLIQHIKQVHACQPPKNMKFWCRPINHDVLLTCGLCVLVLPDWGTRADHMVNHFNDGISMDLWLLERPGGVVTPDLLPQGDTLRGLSQHYSAYPHPGGTHKCEVCSNTFRFQSNLILHRRQVHNIFRDTDLKKEYWPESTNIDVAGVKAAQATNKNLGQIEEERGRDMETSHFTTNTPLDTVMNTGPFSTHAQAAMISSTTTTTAPTIRYHTPTVPSQPLNHPQPLHPALSCPSSVPFADITRQPNPALTFTPISPDTYPGGGHDTFYSAAGFAAPPLSPSPHMNPLLHMTDEEQERAQRLRHAGFFVDPTSGVMPGLEQQYQHEYGEYVERWPSPYDNGPGGGGQ